ATYPSDQTTIFPRMYSDEERHIRVIKTGQATIQPKEVHQLPEKTAIDFHPSEKTFAISSVIKSIGCIPAISCGILLEDKTTFKDTGTKCVVIGFLE
ncbi:MAG: hypothetical protein ACKO00_00040, partial [Crocinitomicaceae bacterium]